VKSVDARLPDLVCLSHLRWDWVFQRPQHLMVRFARERRVFFVEEPEEMETADEPPRMEVRPTPEGVLVAVPRVPRGRDELARADLVRTLLDDLVVTYGIRAPIAWYYTPMALPWARHLAASVVVYDCMDELSAFAGAAESLRRREVELLTRADVVTTGGASLYEAKRHRHGNVHLFPSSVDVPHFAQARRPCADPADQAPIPRPRLGYFGVIDERMDLDLLAGLAAARPAWQIVLVGPSAKIADSDLPRAANLHYLGRKPYEALPSYLAGWDVALLPFARNEATRFISPTKTPEYLAAGRPVVSTSIRDVVRPYGDRGLVRIADDVDDVVAAVEASLVPPAPAWLDAVDAYLDGMSWDVTWRRMRALLVEAPRRAQAAA
jgi:glycosyltransferase involved in cell wall biosynthesis